jgi:uncharacterized protein (DUF1015 family)
MAIIKAFKGVRPKTGLAEQVASLPYDVMNTAEAREMAKGNPYSFLHVSRAEIDLPAGTDEHSQQVYDKARQTFYKMISDGVLVQDEKPILYIYAQEMNGRKQFGLVACSSIDDYFNDVIKKHELTRTEKEQDRIEHMQTLQAHVGPIFLTYPKNNNIDALVENVVVYQKPVYDFKAEDNIGHTVWVIDDLKTIEAIISIFDKQIPYTYIADGHHRTASAAKVGKKLREQNPAHNGQEEYNFFLSVLFSDNQLAIMDYNRVVKDLNGNTIEEFLTKAGQHFSVSKTANKKPSGLHHITMYLDGAWYELTPKPGSFTNDAVGVLDISILQNNLLSPVLGIADPRTDKRIDFIGGIRGLEELERRVNSGEMKVAFALYPVSLQQLMDIANSGNIMPPKSTWFEPKLRDGLFSHLF